MAKARLATRKGCEGEPDTDNKHAPTISSFLRNSFTALGKMSGVC